MSDVYVRIDASVELFESRNQDRGLLFIDLAFDGLLGNLRSLGHRLISEPKCVVLRSALPADSASVERAITELGELYDRMGWSCPAGVMSQPVEEESSINGPHWTGEDHADVLSHARSLELCALVEWGNAVWRSVDFHYRLPSGEHAAGFVRLADVFRSTRDAQSLASWLHADLRDGVGIVYDTKTLVPLILALQTAAARAGIEVGTTRCLDEYPRTDLAVLAAVQAANSRGSGLIAVLSVNSSGGVLDRLSRAAMMGRPNVDPSDIAKIHIVVDKHARPRAYPAVPGVTLTRWHPSPGQDPFVAAGPSGGERCALCENFATARLVPIDVHTFDGRLRSTVKRIVPRPSDADKNRDLWEHADRVGAFGIEAAPHPATVTYRPIGQRLPVRVDLSLLVADAQWRVSAAAAIERAARQAEEDPNGWAVASRRGSDERGGGPVTVVVPAHEWDDSGTPALIGALSNVFGDHPAVVKYSEDGFTPADRSTVEGASAVSILSLGVISGVTLQRCLVAVQSVRPDGGYDLSAVVCHARPPEKRAWATLQNSFGGRVLTGWESYLPEAHSPIADEARVLEEADPAPGSVAARFVEERLGQIDAGFEIEDGTGGALSPLFWGATEVSHLSPDSIFGQGIGQRAVFVAVASAMERARKDAPDSSAPERRVFELPAMLKSYYDPLILASMLRWLKPHEIWWGWEEADADRVVDDVLNRASAMPGATNSYLDVLLPEMMLATLQGKIPERCVSAMVAKAEVHLASSTSPHAIGALEFALSQLREGVSSR